jgi:hypothetical protein
MSGSPVGPGGRFGGLLSTILSKMMTSTVVARTCKTFAISKPTTIKRTLEGRNPELSLHFGLNPDHPTIYNRK